MTSISPGSCGSVESASVLQAQAFGPSLEESLQPDSSSNISEFDSVEQLSAAGGASQAVSIEESPAGSHRHCGAVEAQADLVENCNKSSSDKCKKLQRSASVAALPDVTAVRGEGTLCGKKQVSQSPVRKLHFPASPVSLASGSQMTSTESDGNTWVKTVSHSPVNKMQDDPGFPAYPVSHASGSQVPPTECDGNVGVKAVCDSPVNKVQDDPGFPAFPVSLTPDSQTIAATCEVVPETRHDVCATRESAVGKGKAAADSAGNDTPAPSPAINPVAAKSAPDPACNTDISDEESQFSCESAPATGASAALGVHAKQPPKSPTAESPPVPCPEDIPTIINQLIQAYNDNKKKEAEIVAQQKLIRAANKNKRGRLELDMITLKGELFEVKVTIERLLTKVGPWRERFENMERFEKMQTSLKEQVPYGTHKPNTTSSSASSDTEGEFKEPEAPSRSLKRATPKGRGSETINWQHMVFDRTRGHKNHVIPAMEVSSNQSAASGVSGVVHGDESGVNSGVSVAVLGEASAHSDPVVMGAQEVLVVAHVLEDDVWTGGWKTEVKLRVVNNVPQHLPNTFFIGKEKCICFYAGQAKRCFKCESLNHLASSCAVEKCILCGKIGHTKRFCKDIKCNLCGNMGHPHHLCPMASHNKNNLVVENQVEQEEDQLLIEAVHEIENQHREEQQRHEGTKSNQLQQRETRGSGWEVDQRSSPQPCPSSTTKGLSQTVIGSRISPDPNPHTHHPGTVSPKPTQCISETPVSMSE
ncbi:hypothetical protein XELAEV_18008619mg [Xenopus laevis]|uniref:CCHC-type domain-containing protein n=1 Tax=Xenopus laevis TaxID=8355 RepID=A0A974E4X5_XENLA|nr:hypothetical protein XELAEV_18008619mg [Xenopus laevis]